MSSTMPDPGFGFTAEDADAVVAREERDRWDDAEVIDQALRLVADHHAETGALLGRAGAPPTPAELRRSPLGRDLRLLAGATRESAPAAVQAAAIRVLDLLLRPLAADERPVPARFWTTGLGQVVARAERAVRSPSGLLTPDEAAARLGADRATVEAWLADGALPSVPDEDGRPLVPKAAVERRRLVALELVGVLRGSGDVLLAEHPLAS